MIPSNRTSCHLSWKKYSATRQYSDTNVHYCISSGTHSYNWVKWSQLEWMDLLRVDTAVWLDPELSRLGVRPSTLFCFCRIDDVSTRQSHASLNQMLSAVAHWDVSFNAAMRDDDPRWMRYADYPPLKKIVFRILEPCKNFFSLASKVCQ